MRTRILDVNVDAQIFADAVEMLLAWAGQPAKRYVCTCPVYTLMMAREQPRVGRALAGAAMVTADGMPLVWLQRRRGVPQAQRVYGPDLLRAMVARSADHQISHYFWGGMPGVAAQLAQRLHAAYPRVMIAGFFSPPIADVTETPDPQIIEHLNRSGAHIIWVGLGSPKQDLWMALYRPHLDAPLLIGVGAAFDFVAGIKAQAPLWMQRSGLEWLFRLSREPRRLGRRYLVYNTRFLWHLLRESARSLDGEVE